MRSIIEDNRKGKERRGCRGRRMLLIYSLAKCHHTGLSGLGPSKDSRHKIRNVAKDCDRSPHAIVVQGSGRLGIE